MPPLTIVAHIHAAPGKAAFLRTELERLVAPTRAEAGCIQYDLHHDNADPDHFMFFELWASRDLWQAHMQAPHIAAFGASSAGAVAGSSLYEMTPIA